MAAANGHALWVLNHMYMYTNIKGAFVHVLGRNWLITCARKLLRAHVELLRAHVVITWACNSNYVRTWNYYVHTWKLLRAHVKLLRKHVIVITCAREVMCARKVITWIRNSNYLRTWSYYVRTWKVLRTHVKRFDFFSPCLLRGSIDLPQLL